MEPRVTPLAVSTTRPLRCGRGGRGGEVVRLGFKAVQMVRGCGSGAQAPHQQSTMRCATASELKPCAGERGCGRSPVAMLPTTTLFSTRHATPPSQATHHAGQPSQTHATQGGPAALAPHREHDRVHGSDARARQHGGRQLRHHGQVDRHGCKGRFASLAGAKALARLACAAHLLSLREAGDHPPTLLRGSPSPLLTPAASSQLLRRHTSSSSCR